MMPAHNSVPVIGRAVEIALEQPCQDLDGSSDDTAEVLRPYEDRIHYIRRSNGGAAAAMIMD
jgi:glycosyltransferase involved in cell wall biosynthesis